MLPCLIWRAVKHVIVTLIICQKYLFRPTFSDLDAHSRNKFTEVVVYFVTFSLIRPYMNGTIDKQGQTQDCFSPGGAVKAVQWPKQSISATFRACADKVVSEGWCAPSEAGKNAFLKLNSCDLVHIFWQHFTKNLFSFGINYWLHYHVSSSSCFDTLARPIANLWPLKKGVSEGGSFIRS